MLLTIDLPNELKPQLTALALDTGKNEDEIARNILLEHLKSNFEQTNIDPANERIPNAETLQAIAELESGQGYTVESIDDFLEWLNED